MESKKAARTGSPQNIFHNSGIYRTGKGTEQALY
jgi:hypothetical protein